MKSMIGIAAIMLVLKLVITPEIAFYILLGLGLLMVALLLERIFQHE